MLPISGKTVNILTENIILFLCQYSNGLNQFP